MNVNCYDKLSLNLAGERVEFNYNRALKEVHNPLFPGIPIHKITLNCGHVIDNVTLVKIIEAKIAEFELEVAKFELYKIIESIKNDNH
jgi:hypothetical protein